MAETLACVRGYVLLPIFSLGVQCSPYQPKCRSCSDCIFSDDQERR